MILADIGNTSTKIYESGRILSMNHAQALKTYKKNTVYYISVNPRVTVDNDNWIDINDTIDLDSAYRGMGIDRKALCLAVTDGVLVDAGSAITVDVMQSGVHLGGYILPGLQAYQECYGRISDALDVGINPNIDFDTLPQNTPDAISYGIIASITALLKETIRDRVYFTGGDGKFLAKHFDNAMYDETLVFKGMMKGLQ